MSMKNASKTSRSKNPVATRVRKIKIESCFPFAIASRNTTFSTLRSCNKKNNTGACMDQCVRDTHWHGQHILFAKLSDSSCVFKLLINY